MNVFAISAAQTSDIDEEQAEEEDLLRLREAALGAALKLAVFKGNTLQSPPTAVLASCLSMFPLDSATFEARDAHDVIAELLLEGDRRLLGNDLSLLPQCLMIVAQLQSGFELAVEEISSYDASIAEEDEFWESQAMKRSFGIKFEILSSQLPERIEIDVLRSALTHLPDEGRSMYSSWL